MGPDEPQIVELDLDTVRGLTLALANRVKEFFGEVEVAEPDGDVVNGATLDAYASLVDAFFNLVEYWDQDDYSE